MELTISLIGSLTETSFEYNTRARVTSSVRRAYAHSNQFQPKSLPKNPFFGLLVVAAYFGAEFPYFPVGTYGVLYDVG